MSEKVKPKCQVAGCENRATKRNTESGMKYCDKHADMKHNYVIRDRSVPFRFENIPEADE